MRPSLVKLIVVALLAVGIAAASRKWRMGEELRQRDIAEFVGERDPGLKVKRDEILATIRAIKTSRDMLAARKGDYRSEAAKARLDFKLARIDGDLDSLGKALAAIDEKIELAMVERDIRSSDSGGLDAAEANELLESASGILEQARAMAEEAGESSEAGVSTDETAGPRKGAESSAVPAPSENPESELKRIDAAISLNESSSARAWEVINRLTANRTIAVVANSPAYHQCRAAEKVILANENELPRLKARRLELVRQAEESR